MSKYSPCNDCGIDVETESCNTCEVDSLRKQVDSLRTRAESAEEWKRAVEDAAVVSWVTIEGKTPREAVNALLARESQVALDPAVSEKAAELYKRAESAERENEGLTLSALQSQRQADALLKKLHAAERERDEACAKGLLQAAVIVEEEGLDNCSCVDGEKCESCYTVDDILERLKAERP